MALGPRFTMVLFYILLFLSFLFGYLYYDIEDETKEYALEHGLIKDRKDYDENMKIVTGILFLNAAGCLVNKVMQDRCIWLHSIAHTIVLFVMYYARKGEVNRAHNKERVYIRYSWMVDIPCLIYIITYILSIHLIIIRYGLTRRAERLYCEIHAATGVVSFISSAIGCIIYAYSQKLLIAFPYKNSYLGQNYLICSVLAIMVLVLEPNFGWRHMKTMFGKSPDKRGKTQR